jgi:hypothetical protein
MSDNIYVSGIFNIVTCWGVVRDLERSFGLEDWIY